MPLLPLPPETSLAGGDLPVSEAADVLAEFPRPQRNPESAPVRDAFAEAFAAGFIEYQSKAEEVAAQTDPLRATGIHLQARAAERGVVPGRSESESSLRARIFATPDIVTPESISDAVDAIIAPLTCHVCELNLDGWFVPANGGTSDWCSFVGSEPNYPDRYYDDVTNGLPGGAVPSNGLPRSFHVRIPVVGTEDEFSAIGEFYAGAGAYVFADPQTAAGIYDAIIARVQAIKGQGISWSLVVDPTL